MPTVAPTKTKSGKFVGERVRRVEDPRLMTGAAAYVDDIRRPELLHIAVVRSLYAAAKINSIDTSKAAALPGVQAVYTGKDVVNVGSMPSLRVPEVKVLAQDRVFFVGHAVAAVVAADRYTAEDAAELIEVDYDPTDSISDPEAAIQPGALKVHPEYDDNISFTFEQSGGDVEKAFAEADIVVKKKIYVPRLAPTPMETRGVLAEWDDGQRELTVHSSTQIPHLLKTQLALMMSLPEHRVRVIAPDVGGGFGSKCNVWAEEGLVCFAAIQLRKPVKWIETRRESIMLVAHGRGHVDTIEISATKDGTLTGLKLHILQDSGAHHQLLSPIIPTLSVLMIPGLYKFRSFEAKLEGVFTNRAPTDLYRGAGRPEATFVIERIVDKMANALGMDPAELRKKNFPAPEEFPYQTITGLSYDSGDYLAAFDKALQTIDYQQVRKDQAAARKQGRLAGVGLSTYGELCAFGPCPATPAGGWESATVNVEATGTVMTGISPHGQGEQTAFSQMVADRFHLALEDVNVVHGDTAKVHYGIGTFGSRGIAIGGTALHLALDAVEEKAIKYAAHILGCKADDIVFEAGIFTGGGKTLSFGDLALEAHLCRNLPPGTEPGLAATKFYEPSNFAFPFGAHIAVVEVGRDTGEVDIQRYVAVDDCGKVINPLLVDGQVHGGGAQGLGPAFLEEVVYDETGNC